MEFKFVQNPLTKKYVIIAPKRARRPDVSRGVEPKDPFCPGRENLEPHEVFRLGPGAPFKPTWEVRVVPNKFPFAPIHEIIIHSPDHHENFEDLSFEQVQKIIWVYRTRSQTHEKKGNVYIFHNHGRVGGESLPHPHTQLAVIPQKIPVYTERLGEPDNLILRTKFYSLYTPSYSAWPYELWVVPDRRGHKFSEIQDSELEEFSAIVQKVIQVLRRKFGPEFPYNFYIYPGGDWYWRIIPRSKSIGGFELSSQIFVNTVDPEQAKKYFQKNLDL